MSAKQNNVSKVMVLKPYARPQKTSERTTALLEQLAVRYIWIYTKDDRASPATSRLELHPLEELILELS
jgi:hypothetical protein